MHKSLLENKHSLLYMKSCEKSRLNIRTQRCNNYNRQNILHLSLPLEDFELVDAQGLDLKILEGLELHLLSHEWRF